MKTNSTTQLNQSRGYRTALPLSNSLISVLESYFVSTTAVPRPKLSVRAALALFTPISRNPLDPR